jgi:hypothetical protein
MTILPCTLLERVVPTAPTRFRAAPTSTGGKLSAPALGLRAISSLPPLPPLFKHPLRSLRRRRTGWQLIPPHQGTSREPATAGRNDGEIALVATNFER